MDYNTSLPKLVIPEYGRNIQKMVDFALAEPSRERRTTLAHALITLMGNLNPQLRDVADYKHKLWDHLFIISDFKLDVDSPYPIPAKETLRVKPQRVPYPNSNIRYKYYGKTMEEMIRKISQLEDGPKKEAITQNVANFMKMSYLTWNKDTVDDSTILGHLEELSKGKVKLAETVRLNHTNELLALNREKERERRAKDQHKRGNKNRNKRKK